MRMSGTSPHLRVLSKAVLRSGEPHCLVVQLLQTPEGFTATWRAQEPDCYSLIHHPESLDFPAEPRHIIMRYSRVIFSTSSQMILVLFLHYYTFFIFPRER